MSYLFLLRRKRLRRFIGVERLYARFEFGEFFAGADEQLGLNVELLACDQIELGEGRVHHRAQIFFQIFCRALREDVRHAAVQLFKEFGDLHGGQSSTRSLVGIWTPGPLHQGTFAVQAESVLPHLGAHNGMIRMVSSLSH